jgi:hypothetical protein
LLENDRGVSSLHSYLSFHSSSEEAFNFNSSKWIAVVALEALDAEMLEVEIGIPPSIVPVNASNASASPTIMSITVIPIPSQEMIVGTK